MIVFDYGFGSGSLSTRHRGAKSGAGRRENIFEIVLAAQGDVGALEATPEDHSFSVGIAEWDGTQDVHALIAAAVARGVKA